MKIKISLSLIVAILTLLAFLPAGRLAVLPSPAAAQSCRPIRSRSTFGGGARPKRPARRHGWTLRRRRTPSCTRM